MLFKHFKPTRYNFTFDFFEKKKIIPFFESIVNSIDNKKVLNESFITNYPIGNTLHEIKFIPPYFDVNLIDLSNNHKSIKFHRHYDFLVNLEGKKDTEEYLKSIMTPKIRKQLRSKKRRLETCFKISYILHSGYISQEKFDFLFDRLKRLVERRFEQRGDLFYLINKWTFLKEYSYHLILEKRASLFVIYDNENPISINLSYHFENIMLSLISSYDIDYSKFGIGQIATFKKIEWCFKNNFKILDLMWGDLPHKKMWCNDIRKYQHYFIYENNHLLKTLYVKIFIRLYRIKDRLDQKKIKKSLIELSKSLKNYFQSKIKIIDYGFKIEVIDTIPLSESMSEININNKQYSFLRKPVYDFQYLNFDKTNDVSVFKINDLKNSYLIKGTRSQIKILTSIK